MTKTEISSKLSCISDLITAIKIIHYVTVADGFTETEIINAHNGIMDYIDKELTELQKSIFADILIEEEREV